MSQFAQLQAELTNDRPVGSQRGGAGGRAPVYNEAQVNAWLAWLAGQMRRRDLTLFQIEKLQPDWLTGYKETLPHLLLTHISWSMLIWSVLGISIGSNSSVVDALSLGIIMALVFGLPQGLLWGLLAQLTQRYHFAPFLLKYVKPGGLLLIGPLIGGLFNGVLFGLVGWLLSGVLGEHGFTILCIFGFSGGLLAGFIASARVERSAQGTPIRPIEAVRWSWYGAAANGAKGLFLGLIGGLSISLINGQFYAIGEDPMFGLIMGLMAGMRIILVAGPLGGLLGSVIGGFQPVARDQKRHPNQGIWLTLWASIKFSLPAGIGGGLLAGWLFAEPLLGFAVGLVTILCIGSWYGGLDVVEHAIVRLILAWRGHAPLDYARLLAYATTELQLLQQVGGGYRFADHDQWEACTAIAGEQEDGTPPAATPQ